MYLHKDHQQSLPLSNAPWQCSVGIVATFPFLYHFNCSAQPPPSRQDMLVYIFMHLSMALIIEVRNSVTLVLLAGPKATVVAVAFLAGILGILSCFCMRIRIGVLGSLCPVLSIPS